MRLTNVALVVIALVIIFAGVILLQVHSNSTTLILVKDVSSINQIVEVNPNTIAFAGSYNSGNRSYGVAGLVFIQNHSYVFFNVSNYFMNGSIYTLGYNGTTYLLGGARYVQLGNSSVLAPTAILLEGNRVYNISGEIPNFYVPGQIFAVSWENGYWLLGGSSLVVEQSSKFQVPFLLKLTTNITDITNRLPSFFYTPLSVGSGIFTISSYGNSSFVGGTHLFNYTIAIYNGTSFVSSEDDLGAVITSVNTPLGWLFGGFNYSLTDTQITTTLLGLYNESGIHFIKLKYEVGVVNSVGYGDGKYLVSLRVPVVNNFTGISSEEGIILSGNSPYSLTQAYSRLNTTVNSILDVGSIIVGGGYIFSGSGEQGAIIVIK
ncbi:hypothetical protein [Metallosphaera hakonensis]|uniref:Uncharacterized protein n=1 Tax=Metallosphaera hakonensis JCM 8857 = DSM 7519 TaxID=1293036 RepID=A0A2U9IWR6_9CREN|nr:hypothetical protein [Metallosphaera hakonensis]AWS00542.1 hypothetical protein DFR87_03975 [Metallosphaera hakonensis JCM 8857 = DSM 7519]